MNQPKTLVFLPTYNERENIRGMVESVLAQGDAYEVIVVDDNSPDGTAALAEALAERDARVHVLVRIGSRGRGYAMIDAIRWMLERDYAALVEMDADWSHDPAYIPDISKALVRADVAICSRLVPGGGERNRPRIRQWITFIANFYIRLVLGLRVRDCTTGFRGYRRAALQSLDTDALFCPGPALLQELLFILTRKNFSVVEIPFLFEQRRAGRSKINLPLLLLSLANVWNIRKIHGAHTERNHAIED